MDLSVKDTLRTWCLLELCNSLVGLGAVPVIDVFVQPDVRRTRQLLQKAGQDRTHRG